MTRFLQVTLVLFLSLAAAALDNEHARYLGGTEPSVTAGMVGHLDTTSEKWLIFEDAGNKLSIPYASIDSYGYTEEVARHLGVLPTIAVGLVKVRQRQHFLSVSFHDQNGTAQVAVFELPKHMPRILMAVLQTRAPLVRKPCRSFTGLNGTTMHRGKCSEVMGAVEEFPTEGKNDIVPNTGDIRRRLPPSPEPPSRRGSNTAQLNKQSR